MPHVLNKRAKRQQFLLLASLKRIRAQRHANADPAEILLSTDRITSADLLLHALADQLAMRRGGFDRFFQRRVKHHLSHGNLRGLLRQFAGDENIGNPVNGCQLLPALGQVGAVGGVGVGNDLVAVDFPHGLTP